MNTTDTDTLIDFISSQMDGDQAPPAGTADEQRIADAIRAIQKRASDKELINLGLKAMGTVIARMSSSIAAQGALMKFIAPGDRE
ncbi:hypothetical protein ASE11_19055 [Hydrogenophaga sp. Root209]|uniref:hypothetical protein n=1 Tax=Hydrogenophaga sp. Root209 TaxID=1736490 RepID=UPI0006FD742C|nr:hypothetical protein [Hydrogenophaga sp. Root209]KRC11508.1 hypothetical protein ASE11_19055 [Hydrogenophaga sp. Root209]